MKADWLNVQTVIQCYTRGDILMTISLRLSEEDAKLNKDYAKINNISVSDLIRQAVIEKIEDEIDLTAYNKVVKEVYSKSESVMMRGSDSK
ncbi:MAG: hypothetical protein IJH00_03250 [Erysipelotrichaceae bacterium]|nr:hypothetical protein [Erysipelotrichaceae bacterium]